MLVINGNERLRRSLGSDTDCGVNALQYVASSMMLQYIAPTSL